MIAGFDIGLSSYFNKHYVPEQTMRMDSADIRSGLASTSLMNVTGDNRSTSEIMYRVSCGTSDVSRISSAVGGHMSRQISQTVPPAIKEEDPDGDDVSLSSSNHIMEEDVLKEEDVDDQMFVFPKPGGEDIDEEIEQQKDLHQQMAATEAA